MRRRSERHQSLNKIKAQMARQRSIEVVFGDLAFGEKDGIRAHPLCPRLCRGCHKNAGSDPIMGEEGNLRREVLGDAWGSWTSILPGLHEGQDLRFVARLEPCAGARVEARRGELRLATRIEAAALPRLLRYRLWLVALRHGTRH